MLFSPPSYVGAGCDFVSDFHAFEDGSLLGPCGRAWIGSTDGGVTWSSRFNETQSPPVAWGRVGALVVTDGLSMHEAGNLSVPNATANYTQLVGTSSARLARVSGGFSVTAQDRRVSFGAIPSPGVTCWPGRGLKCPIHFAGSSIVKLSDVCARHSCDVTA
jgi:hypothetical protein